VDDDYYAQPPRSPLPGAVFASIITTLAVFFGLRLLDQRGMMPSFAKMPASASESVEVPAILGMRPEQARELLKGRDLLLSLSSERDDGQHPAGTIADQNPLPGSQAARGGAIQAVLSRGAKQVPVPKLAGMTFEDAVKELAAVGLGIGKHKQAPSDKAPPGTVIDSEPSPGTALLAKTTVVLVVSSGAAARAVPKLGGMRLRAARELLEQQGFKVGKIRFDYDDGRNSGVVLGQKPAPPATASPGTPIDLLVNED
jgi:beta-lactam-binding protein with PASTA domain